MRIRIIINLLVIIFLFSFANFVYATDSLIAHWKFDAGSGTTPVDSGPNNISASFTSTNPTWSSDVPSVAFSNPYSLSFAGSGDGVTITWPTELNFSDTAPRTFSFWYKPTANGEGSYSRIISWSNDRLEIAGTEAGPTTHKITYFDGNWHATNITLSIGTWYHVTFTYDGTTAKFYIGDELQDEHSLAGRSLSGTLRIGNRVQQLDEGINGNIDDVRIYNYALTSTQVANLADGSDNPDSPPDSTAPVISSIASSTNATGATITWTTDEVASTKVVYSVNTQYASSTAEADTGTRVTSHSQALSNLLGCTQYNFKVVSRDAAGNSATSSGSTFLTTGCAGSVTPSSATSSVVTVSSAATSTLTDSSRSITVASPANFTNASTSVVIQIKGLTASTVIDSIGKPSSSLSTASGIVFDVTALIDGITRVESFDSPVTITYAYTDSDISGIDESTLKVYRYSNSTWSELSNCSVNTSANTITCSTSGFSVFGVFGTATQSASDSSTSSSSQRGASIKTRVANLIAMGKNSEAQALKNEWSWLFANASNQASTQTSASSVFVRDLKIGMKGKDVMGLQKKLNSLGFIIASSGPGSVGMETEVFGSLTRAALVAYQKAYNISPAVGYFGPITRAHMLSIQQGR